MGLLSTPIWSHEDSCENCSSLPVLLKGDNNRLYSNIHEVTLDSTQVLLTALRTVASLSCHKITTMHSNTACMYNLPTGKGPL